MLCERIKQDWTEAERLAALARYAVLDTPPERSFDAIVQLVSQLLDAPIAAINLLADGRQWFKAEIGLGVREMPLEDSICKYAILTRKMMVVPDTMEDPRFKHNPLVKGEPWLRFYAGEILTTPEGFPLGTLCVLDTKPRPEGFTDLQQFALRTLADQVMTQLELRWVLAEQQRMLDVHARVGAELRAERDRSRQILEGMEEGFIFLDKDFVVREINAGAMRFELRPASQILGRSHWEAWPGSEHLPVGDAYRRAMQENIPVNVEQFYVYPDGRGFWTDIRAYPTNGGLAVFYRNINERKEHEKAVRQSEYDALEAAREAETERSRLLAVLEATPVGIAVAEASGALRDVNAAFRRLWGTTHSVTENVDHREWKGWWADGSERHGRQIEPSEWAMARALQGEEVIRNVIEIETFHTPPIRRTVLMSGAPIYDTDENIIGCVVAQMDITDRVKAEEALRQADRRKDEFLAMLGHELRNPLAPIAAAAELLAVGRLDESRVKQTSAIISRQVRHMTGLVDDLLDMARVTRGQVTLDKQKLDAKRIVADAVEQVRPLIEARRHRLAVHAPPDAAFVLGDEKRLVQVVSNLLSNAAKYTPDGGNISISLDATPQHVKLIVTDTGIGMEPELLEHAFELFIQAHRPSDRSQGGLGIGLALVKNLVELQGGTVAVQSEGMGKGSQFSVCLPRLTEHLWMRGMPGRPDTGRTSPMKPLNVMVVDDNVDAAAVLKMYVEALGYHASVEHTSVGALERSKLEAPDVFLLDIGLPDINGLELVQRLRAQPATAEAVLVAVTGYGQEEDRKRAYEAGFDHHFVKPIDSATLKKLLADIAQQLAC